jgi:hypothetical protein
MPRVTMGLTDEDVDNANHIYASTPARTRAQAVSFALALTRFLVEQRRRGASLILDRNGEFERVVMPDLDRVTEPNPEKLRRHEAAAAE